MKRNTFTVLITLLLFIFLYSGKTFSQSNNCSTATPLTVNTACVTTSGTTAGFTESIAGCAGTADDDGWYQFVANNTNQTITVHPNDLNYDPVVQLFSGTCAALVSLSCKDLGFDGDDEIIYASGLTVGATYYIRVYHYYIGSGSGAFTICVQGTSSAIPANDEPCNAIPLPAVTSACSYQMYTTTGATASVGPPTPSTCTGGSAPQQGGWSASSKDVWFKVVVPSSGELVINAKPSGVGVTDGVLALYSGTCGSLTQIECYDDYSHLYPTVSSNQPMIIRSGLTPGQTLYIRFWGFGSSSGTFGICTSTPTNDNCSNALYICDLNNYSGTTSGAYIPDYPSNMDGTWAGTWWQGGTSYTRPGTGPFGWGHSPNDVQINNNSWVRFTAAASTATLFVTVSDCWKTTPLGIQMQIFSASNCTNFDTVSNFSESNSTLTVTARNLTIGQDYYLMVDGFAGDICNYTIKATGGILFTEIAASSTNICLGQSVTLTGPAGASSYEWVHNGASTQTVSVTPASAGTTTYTLYAYGVCGAKQTLTKTITVNALPIANAGIDKTTCRGTAVALSATGGTGYSWSPSTGLSATNISNTSANPTNSTTYIVTVTNAAGCTATDNVLVTVNALPTANAGSDVTIPNGTNTTLSAASGGAGTYSYSWTPAASLVNANIQSPTTVNLTSTTAFTLTVANTITGCQNTDQVVVTVSGSVLNTSVSATPQTICAGQSTQLFALAGGGSGSYTYSWSSNPIGFSSASQNPTVSPTTSTTFYVTVNDGFNNVNSSVAVTVNPLPVANAGSDAQICQGKSTNLSASGGGSYSWSPSTGLSATNISNPVASPGSTSTYIVTVTSAAGCSATDNITITVNSNPVANAGIDASFCAGSSQNLSASGGNSYAWSPSTGLSSTVISNPVASPSSSTTYVVTVTNSSGCTATDNVLVTVNALPTINAGTDVSIPNGTATSLSGTASGGSGSYSITWSPGSLLNNPNILNPTTINLSTTTIFTLAVTDNVTGCQQSDQIVVTVTGGALNSSANASPSTICAGESVQLFALVSGGSGIYTYSWSSNPAGFTSASSSPTVSPSSSTIYVLSVSDGFNSIVSNAFVNVNPNPTATAGSDISLCSGSGQYLNAGGGTTYSWSPATGLSSPSVSSPYANPTSTTNYTVTVSNIYGCSATDNILVTVNPVPSATAGSDFSICLGTSSALNATGGVSYAWSPSAGLSNSSISNPTTSPANSTNYLVTVTNAQGCTDSDDITITVNPLPTADAGLDQSICNGHTFSINASGGVIYAWNPTTGLDNGNINNPQASPTITTSYLLTVTDVNGCTDTDDILITVNENPVASAGNDNIICFGTIIILNASGGGTYQWSPSTGLNNPNISNPEANPTATTTYTINITDVNGCSDSDELTITVNPVPIADAGADQTLCEGTPATISASGGTHYLWSSGETTSGFTAAPLTTTTYTVTVSNDEGCSATDNIILNINPLPYISLTAYPQESILYTGQSMNITALPDVYPAYSFYLDSLLIQTGNLNFYEFTGQPGEQILYVFASENGCNSAIDSIPIIVKPIPNAFTPNNNDGVNDVFLKGLNVSVFNRWGQKLYSGKDGWNGKFNGKYVSPGTYFFTADFPGANKNTIQIKGTVSVIE